MSARTLIINTQNASLAGFLPDFFSANTSTTPDAVRGDANTPLTISPVIPSVSGGRPWDYDYEDGDVLRFSIGLPDAAATGGTFALTVGGVGTGMEELPYNASAESIQVLISALGVDVLVLKLKDGAYEVITVANGTLGAIAIDATNLLPECQYVTSIIAAGGAGAKAHQVFVIKQQNVATATPSTPLPDAGITITLEQVFTLSSNAIYRIHFDAAGTYGGLYSVGLTAAGVIASCGVIGPLSGADNLGRLLTANSAVSYEPLADDNDVIVSSDGSDYLVEFTGSLGGASVIRTITTNTAEDPTVVTTSTPHGIADGATVIIQGNEGSIPSINGTHTAIVLTPSTFSVPIDCSGFRVISSNTQANPTEITTSADHGYSDGDIVNIPSNNGSDTDISGTHTIDVTSSTTFTIPVDCSSSGGTGGTVTNTSFGGNGGTCYDSDGPILTVADVSLMAPKGLSGTLNLNTLNMVKSFMATGSDTITFQCSVERQRGDATETIYLAPQVVRRDIIDLTALAPMPVPSGVNYRVTIGGIFQFGPDGTGNYTTPTYNGTTLQLSPGAP